ncbi:hypothetical protein [Paenibacillus sp. NPDC055715]
MTKASHVEEDATLAKSRPEPVSANTAESTPALPVPPAPAASSVTRVIGQFVLAQFFLRLGSGLVIPYLNLYFTNRFSVSLSAMSLLIALGQLITILRNKLRSQTPCSTRRLIPCMSTAAS